ncbi:hypothetical protein niasHT_004888 [Heterodera trifolii]|uniref:Uncharacterized protein n=1 Tax=Heterodera trifolii TaxID=157864 RepID=A0ABD2LTZ0_9BILA
MDYAGPFFGKMFLVIVDAYSKWPEIFEMNSTGSAATIGIHPTQRHKPFVFGTLLSNVKRTSRTVRRHIQTDVSQIEERRNQRNVGHISGHIPCHAE